MAPQSLMVAPRQMEKLPTDKPVDDAIALEIATSNNRMCAAETEKLKALQEWVKIPLQDERK